MIAAMDFKEFRRRVLVPCALLTCLASAPDVGAAELSVALEGGWRDLTNAPDSSKAVFGETGGPTFGGTVRMDLGRSFFGAVSGRYFAKEGERVALGPDDEVYPLGHPLTLRMVPVYGTVGYRFNFSDRLVPYVGVGGGVTLIHEESEIGGETESTDATKPTGVGLVGVEYGGGRFRVGGELGYMLVPDALGDEGLADDFGETDLGGFSAVFKVVISL
jgi:hypothetical protein